jgi:hypothetical protein
MKTSGTTSLANSIEPLRQHFNDQMHRLRFLALVSPM